MEKPSYIFSSDGQPQFSGFLGGVILIALFEFALAWAPRERVLGAPFDHLGLSLKSEVADSGGDFDALFLGDCIGWVGIKPSVIEKRTGATSYNFCVNVRQTLALPYLMLRRYLENSRQAPRLVVVQVSTLSFLSRVTLSWENLESYILPYFRVEQDLLAELEPTVRTRLRERSWQLAIPSVRSQFILREPLWLLKMFRDQPEFDRYRRYFRDERGHFIQDPSSSAKEAPTVDRIPGLVEPELNFQECLTNFNYLEKIFELCRVHDIRVALASSPEREDRFELLEQHGVLNRLQRRFRSLVEPGRAEVFWDLSQSVSQMSYYMDEVHLTSEGADLYSKALSDSIATLDGF